MDENSDLRPGGVGAGEIPTIGNPSPGQDDEKMLPTGGTDLIGSWLPTSAKGPAARSLSPVPMEVSNDKQGDGTTATFGFYAEQTANNR